MKYVRMQMLACAMVLVAAAGASAALPGAASKALYAPAGPELMEVTLEASIFRAQTIIYDAVYDPDINAWLSERLPGEDTVAFPITVQIVLPEGERVRGVNGRVSNGKVIRQAGPSGTLLEMVLKALLVEVFRRGTNLSAEVSVGSMLTIVGDGLSKLKTPDLHLINEIEKKPDGLSQLGRYVEFDLLLAAKHNTILDLFAIETEVVGGADAGRRRIYPVVPLSLKSLIAEQ